VLILKEKIRSITFNGGDGTGGKFSVRRIRAQLLFLGLVILFSSCSIKKNEEVDSVLKQLDSLQVASDSDNDGISDSLEFATGTNPSIADIPKLSIGLVKDISISAIFNPISVKQLKNQFLTLKQEFSEIDDVKGGDIDFLKVLRKKVVINQYNHLRNVKSEKSDIITTEDLRANILSNWEDTPYYGFMNSLPEDDNVTENNSGKFISNFRVKLTNVKNVTEISDVGVKSFFYNYEKMTETEIYNHYLLKESGSKERFKLNGTDTFSSITTYPLIANEISTTDIYTQLKDRSEVGLKFSDYSYIMSGVPLNYTEVISKVLDGDAKVVFSNGKKTEIFFVAPGLTIEQALVQMGNSIKLNNFGDIYSINEIETTAKYPIDVDSLKLDDFKKGIWSVFGDADNLLEKVKPQGLYVISYSTVGEILNSSKRWISLVDKEFTNSFTVENIYEGDELLLSFNFFSIVNITESISNTQEGEVCVGSGCNFAPTDRRGPTCNCRPGCSQSKSTPIFSENKIDPKNSDLVTWLSFKDTSGGVVNAKVYTYGKNIRVKFFSLPKSLKNKVVVTLKNPKYLTSTARVGVITSTCETPSFSIQTFENQFKIRGSVKVYGINKY